jgi:hypothetical protein
VSPVIVYRYDPTGDDWRGCGDEVGFYRHESNAIAYVEKRNAELLERLNVQRKAQYDNSVTAYHIERIEHDALYIAGLRSERFNKSEPAPFVELTALPKRHEHYYYEPMEFDDDRNTP